jgi:hypothetical protein
MRCARADGMTVSFNYIKDPVLCLARAMAIFLANV